MDTAQIYDSDLLEQHIEQLLLLLGIPAHLKGFRYLTRAVCLRAAGEFRPGEGVDVLRRRVAEEYAVTGYSVERDIRTALHKIQPSACASLLSRPEMPTCRSLTFREFLILCVNRLESEEAAG